MKVDVNNISIGLYFTKVAPRSYDEVFSKSSKKYTQPGIPELLPNQIHLIENQRHGNGQARGTAEI